MMSDSAPSNHGHDAVLGRTYFHRAVDAAVFRCGAVVSKNEYLALSYRHREGNTIFIRERVGVDVVLNLLGAVDNKTSVWQPSR